MQWIWEDYKLVYQQMCNLIEEVELEIFPGGSTRALLLTSRGSGRSRSRRGSHKVDVDLPEGLSIVKVT